MDKFKLDLEIDPNALDVEAVRQGELFFKWAEKAIEAKEKYERTKIRMEVETSELELQIRNNPKDFGLPDKVTEATVKATLLSNPKYLLLNEELLETKKNMMLMDKAVDAMEMKKRMIETLVTLHGQQYFAGPSVPRDLVSAWKQAKEQTTTKVNGKQSKLSRKRQLPNEEQENGKVQA